MKDVKDYLPQISLVLLVVGTNYLVDFYRQFNINILSFLDFTEVLQLQFNFFTLSLLIILMILIWKTEFFIKHLKWINGPQQTDAENPEFRKSAIKSDNVYRYILLSSTLVLALIVSSFLAWVSAYLIKHGAPDYQVSMQVNDIPYKTDSSYVYVGRTKNFIFFYDKKQVRGDVYPNDDVKDLKFFKGKD